MKQIKSIKKIRAEIQQIKAEGKTIAFVPTMGAFHEGHLSLIRMAKQHADEVVVSIYVNPEQFGPNEDFENYPRHIDDDVKACAEEGVTIVFTPDDEVMYGYGKKYFSIKISTINENMDGGSRPGFFEGIVLVVNKLFNIVKPDVAVFGQKDMQQFIILSRMVKEFNHTVELVLAPIKRAEDGLALSSRNEYLSKEERERAPEFYRALKYVEKKVRQGIHEPESMLKHQQEELEAKGFKNDYFNVFSMLEMAPAQKLETGKKYILAGAVYLGKTRLIDNIILDL